MGNFKDLTGMKFNMLTVLEQAGKERGRMTYYKPLTPEFRARINESVRSIEIELNTCQNTPYVTAQKIGLQALENLINALPDGFPLPMKRRDNHDGEGSNKNI